jgi:Asp-tRNA(Asn)/Glu-tRNA(Gln) amidotransferase A subunit family amidase
MAGEAHVTFLSEIRAQPELLNEDIAALAKNSMGIGKSALLAALDAAAECRVAFDTIAADYDAVLTPSARGEAPMGTTTGESALNVIWTLLHVPVVQIPGFKGPSDMPVGLSLTSPRYTDRRLLQVAKAIGPLFESLGYEA